MSFSRNFIPKMRDAFFVFFQTFFSPHTFYRSLFWWYKLTLFYSGVQFIALPDPWDDYDNVTAQVSGWGVTTSNGTSFSDKLMVLDLKTMSNKECRRRWEGNSAITDSMICAGEKGKGVCRGDVGDALTTRGEHGNYFQIGIFSSFSISQGNCDLGPQVYTRLTYFVNWIIRNKSK